MNTDEILAAWTASMRMQNLSDRTIEQRAQIVQQLERHSGKCLMLIRRPDLIAFLGTAGWSGATRQHYRSQLHTLFQWMQDEEIRIDNPAARLPKVRVPSTQPRPMTVSEIERTLAGCYAPTRVKIALYYYAGLRAAEIAAVRGEDIDWEERTLTTVGKGRKVRTIPLSTALWQIIVHMPRVGWWFSSRIGGHVSGNSVSRVLSDAMKRQGIRHTGHHLRASTATLMSRAGVDAFVVRDAMRHESLATTTRYRGVSLDEQRAGFDALPLIRFPTERTQRAA